MATVEIGGVRVMLGMNAGEFTRGTRQAGRDMDTLGDKIAKVSEQINRASIFINTGIMAAQRFAAASSGIFNVASAFEKGMSNVSTLIDTSTESLKDMSLEVLKIGQRTPVAMQDLTTALYDIRSAGIPAADALKVLEGSARLAVAGLGTTKEAADLVTSSINAFGLKGAEADGVFNQIFKTIQAGKTTITQLAQGFGAAAGTVAQAGVKLDEYLASVAALTVTGLPAAEAHTQIRAAIAGLTRESEIGNKVLKTLGAKTFKDLVEQSGGLVGAFEKIRATLQGNDANLIKLLGSVEAYNALIALSGKQNGIFNQTMGNMRDGLDTVSGAFDKQNSTMSASMQRLRNNLEDLGVAMGNTLAPAMDRLAKFVEEITTAFRSLSPEMQELIARIGVFATVTGPAIVAAGFFVNALASLIPVFSAVGAVIGGPVAATGPIGMFVVAATTAVLAWQAFEKDIITIFNSVSAYIGEKIDAIMAKLTALGDLISNVFGALSEGDFTKAWEAIVPKVNEVADAFGNVAMQAGLVSVAVENEKKAMIANVPITDLTTESKKRLGAAYQFMNEAVRDYNRLVGEGENLVKKGRDPSEIMVDQQNAIQAALNQTKITAAEAGEAMRRASLVAVSAYASMGLQHRRVPRAGVRPEQGHRHRGRDDQYLRGGDEGPRGPPAAV
jgi:TP901 family phage tail tape measure protein